MLYKASYFNGNSSKLIGKTSTVIRINRETIPEVALPDTLKGVYVLWGEGEYYVGQGFIKTRITQHFNNKDKHFSRVFILTFTGTKEDYEEFSHYLLDLEGALNDYLAGLNLNSMNKAATLQTNLLPHHTGILQEWVEALHVLDPTFLQPPVLAEEEETGRGQEVVFSITNHPTYEEQEPVYSETTYTYEEDDLHVLAHIPVGKKNAKSKEGLQIPGKDIDELYLKKGAIKRTVEGLYYQTPLVYVYYHKEAVLVKNPLGHVTQRQVVDIQRALHRGSIENGEVIKQPGIPRGIYSLLLEIGAITELRNKKVHYYLSDALADQKEADAWTVYGEDGRNE